MTFSSISTIYFILFELLSSSAALKYLASQARIQSKNVGMNNLLMVDSEISSPNHRKDITEVHNNHDSTMVYIEHTDTFGVVYYANYPVFIERCLSSIANRGRMNTRIRKFQSLKYKAPARLGDEIKISPQQSKRAPGSYDMTLSTNEKDIMIMKRVFLHESPHRLNDHRIPQFYQDKRVHTMEFRLWNDEMGSNHTFTTKTIFNLMERARTTILGGFYLYNLVKLQNIDSPNNRTFEADVIDD
jgi:hypothetical protein